MNFSSHFNNYRKAMSFGGLFMAVALLMQLSSYSLMGAAKTSSMNQIENVETSYLFDVTPCKPGFFNTSNGCVPGGNLIGTLTTAGNKNSPISGAQVILRKFKGGSTATTAANGSFSFTNIEPGNYAEVFIAKGFVYSSVQVTITSGQTTTSNTALVPDIRVTTTCGTNGMINWLLFPFAYTFAILNSNISGSGTLNPGVNALQTAVSSATGFNFLQVNIDGIRAGGGAGSPAACGTATLAGQITALSSSLVAAITNTTTLCPKSSRIAAERLISSAAPSTTTTITACTLVPIRGATVTVKDDTGTVLGSATTDNTGNYNIGNIIVSSPHTFNVYIRAANFLPAIRSIRLSAAFANVLNIQLVPVPPPITFATLQIQNGCTPVISSSLNSVQIFDATTGLMLYQGFTDSNGFFIPASIYGIIVPNSISMSPVNLNVPLPFPQGHALTVKVSGVNMPVNVLPITTQNTISNPAKVIVFINGTSCP